MSVFIILMQFIYDCLLHITDISSTEDELIFNHNVEAFRSVIRITYKMIIALLALGWRGRLSVAGKGGREIKDEDE